MSQQWCAYYQAWVKPSECWVLTAILRSYDHLAFDRTVDVDNSIFEFFVPEQLSHVFESVMQQFISRGIVSDLTRKENRLKEEQI